MLGKNPLTIQIYKQDGKVFAGETLNISLDAYTYKKYAPHVYFYQENKLEFDSYGNPRLTKSTSQQDLMHLKGVTVKVMQLFNQTLEDVFEHFPDNIKVQRARQRWKKSKRFEINVDKVSQVKNAFYSNFEQQPSLALYEFTGKDGKEVKTYQSLDIVVHEFGHFELDIIKPELGRSEDFFAQALTESFADLTAIFFMLEIDELRDLFLQNTKGDLTKDSFLTDIAEEFGAGLEIGASGLRNALGVNTENVDNDDYHSVSQVFTGAIYMILVNLFNYYRGGNQPGLSEESDRFKRVTDYEDYTNPSALLKQIARDLKKFLVFAIIEAGPSPTFCDIKDIIKRHAIESLVEAAFEVTKITRDWEESLKHKQKTERRSLLIAKHDTNKKVNKKEDQ